MAMNQIVKYLSHFVEVCSPAKPSPFVAQGSAARYKEDINEALLNQLKNGKLAELYQELGSWEPHPELASYHVSHESNTSKSNKPIEISQHFLIHFLHAMQNNAY